MAIVGLLVRVLDNAKLGMLCFLVVFQLYWAGLHPHGGEVEPARGRLSPQLLKAIGNIFQDFVVLYWHGGVYFCGGVDFCSKGKVEVA
jgi:hypothetical protein